MHHGPRSTLAAAVAIVAASCAAPQTARPAIEGSTLAAEQQRQSLYVLESRAADYRRVYDIAERLSLANSELCARTVRTIGVRFENLSDYGRDFREAASTLWGLDNRPSVIWVGAESPAAQAGIRERDRILSINGRALPNNRRASRDAVRMLRDASDAGDVVLGLDRGGETVTVNVAPRETCGYEVFMLDDAAVNAAADGRTIYLNRGMLRFVRSDEELALVLGHELAHNAMRHIDAMRQNAAMGAVGGAMLDILAAAAGVNTGGAFTDAGGDVGRMMFAQEFESEADYVGMYFMARAGYDISGVEEFWRRMAAENPRGIRLAYTHPTTAERFLGLSLARDEIAAKQASGDALRPNMADGHATPAPVPQQPPAPTPTQAEPAPAEPAGEPQTPPPSGPVAAAPPG